MKYQKIAIVMVIFASAMLFGCTNTIKIEPIPELKTGNPLAGIEPLIFKINEFEDIRPDKKLVGVGCYRLGPKIVLDDEQKVPEIIAKTITNELKRNGHKVLLSSESNKADVIIDGVVRRYWVAGGERYWGPKVTGDVEVELNVSLNGGEKPLVKTYRGNYYTEHHFINRLNMSSVFAGVINNALLDMLKEFTTDEEFVNVLKKAKRKNL